MGGTYVHPPISSFLAEGTALEHSTLFIRKLLQRSAREPDSGGAQALPCRKWDDDHDDDDVAPHDDDTCHALCVDMDVDMETWMSNGHSPMTYSIVALDRCNLLWSFMCGCALTAMCVEIHGKRLLSGRARM